MNIQKGDRFISEYYMNNLDEKAVSLNVNTDDLFNPEIADGL